MTHPSPRRHRELVLMPSLGAYPGPNGELFLTRKYLEGANEYAKSWPGPVTSLVALRTTPTSDMDHVDAREGEWATSLELRPTRTEALGERLKHSALVFPFLSPSEAKTYALCKAAGVPIVFGSEYSPRTEMQIIDSECRNPLRRLRRKIWTIQAERTRLRMLKEAAGLQCSGTPCFDHYRNHNPNTLLFFDNRVRQSDVISPEVLEAKLAQRTSNVPLRLVFGGRLIAMKGVLDLPLVAAELRRLNVAFKLDIYGTGTLQTALEQLIGRLDLRDHVFMKGVMDFREGWIPMLKRDADLFVCCHPQGDPSSTYPEVMSCGVPIAGYANEAFEGIVRESGCGWVTPMKQPRLLAAKIAELDANREAIAAAARRGREFALVNAFEPTFERRTNHLVAISRLPGDIRQA